ncbi:hypothetical protein CONLIGDRAFT_345537 [Coniochaeta ligniaria NRRL 30616]|uniref:Uncharacterized protein n=1 Tax=Coniochaeta ligniaria NRRL 30616 TaxID=1408157 RepID=A0A1J7JKK8_9PEZI|nr:hypothetical protein CONLIGDRAFT_345537 [Coniochaeta ligniaria NRRL 30616]
MMSTSYSGNIAGLSTFSATDSLLDELTQQLATARHHQNRHVSRGTGGQYQGGAMRVVKPRSAHNSPGSLGMHGRRRAVLNDNQYHHPSPSQPVNENMSLASQMCPDPSRAARPFSWHPPSQFVHQPEPQMLLQPQAQYQMSTSQYPVYSYADADYFNRQLPPTPAVYSGYTSPASAFSPLSLPTTGFEQQPLQYFPQGSWATMPELSPPAPGPAPIEGRLARSSTGTGSDSYSEVVPPSTVDSWNSFPSHGFSSSTAPPTPEDFVQVPQAEPRLQSEESIPYQPLEGEEDDKGEILYGMGLYDTPEKPVDAHLEYHRSAISSLLGSTFAYQEPTGKGLKLEDAWEPPASDDEGSQEEDDDEDAEGDAQDD